MGNLFVFPIPEAMDLTAKEEEKLTLYKLMNVQFAIMKG
jgi:hypothetical protein